MKNKKIEEKRKIKNKPNMKLDFKILKRILGYVFRKYKITFAIVVICLILSTVSSVAGNLYLQTLIDDYIIPLMQTENPVYDSLIKAIITMIGIYSVGVITSMLHSILMAKIGGSSGPLLGICFMNMGMALKDKEKIKTKTLSTLFCSRRLLDCIIQPPSSYAIQETPPDYP